MRFPPATAWSWSSDPNRFHQTMSRASGALPRSKLSSASIPLCGSTMKRGISTAMTSSQRIYAALRLKTSAWTWSSIPTWPTWFGSLATLCRRWANW